MKTSEQGLDLLIAREGSRNKAYLDSVGVWTIGIGHTGPDVHAGLAWTDEQVREAFAKDIQRFERAVSKAVQRELKQHQYDALVSFAFNIGEMGVANSWVVREINNGNWGAAAASFDNWHKPSEIIPRRNGEREQFKGTSFAARINERAMA